MSQEYTPVDWVDETTSQQGTLITAARLDQMQTAHHFTDGFEEVDAVPTADPGVDYHKVVFCTADTTFYRWDGSQWVKDVDDTTAAELAAHEADHDNPHQVTKAQVGLGNVDNTSDLNKPVSGPQQTALNTKADKTQLSDGSVTKVGTATVGGMNTPIYLDAGVPTEGFTPVYAVNNQDGPVAYLTGKDIPWTDTQSPPSVADRLTAIDGAIYDLNAHTVQVDENGDVIGAIGALEVRGALTINGADLTVAEESGTGGSITAKTLDTTGAVTIGGTLAVTGAITGSLTGNVTGNVTGNADTATKLGTTNVGTDTKPIKLVAGVPTPVTYDLVDTNSAQTIGGAKTLTDRLTLQSNAPYLQLKSTATLGTNQYLGFIQGVDANNTEIFDIYPTTDSVGKVSLNVAVSSGGTLKVPTPPSGATDASAVNANWVSQTGDSGPNNLVHKTGNETIANVKQFTAGLETKRSGINRGLTLIRGDVSYGQETTNKGMNYIEWVDGQGVQIAYINATILPNKTTRITLHVLNSDGTGKDLILVTGDVI